MLLDGVGNESENVDFFPLFARITVHRNYFIMMEKSTGHVQVKKKYDI